MQFMNKKTKGNRREFIKNGISGLAAVSLVPALAIGEREEKKSPAVVAGKNVPDPKIVYRTLGRTGIRVPAVSFGCGFTTDPAIIMAALDEGIIYFDTAPGYGGGRSEPILGEVLSGRDRDSFVISSKISLPEDNRTGLIPEGMTASEFRTYFMDQLETRLKLLKVDRLDILYLYDVARPAILGDGMLKDLLAEIKAGGKVRCVGASFHQNEPEMIRACVREKIYDVVLTAYNFRQPHREETREAIAEAAKAGLGVVAMKFMAGVYWDRERKNPIDPSAALKWILQDENVHTVIPGMKTIDELRGNISVMADMELGPEDMKKLKLGSGEGHEGLYCGQCGLCRSQCPAHLDIPRAMRSYMYAYGYRSPLKAKRTLERIPPGMLSCGSCEACVVKCTMGFDVRGRMSDVARILDLPDEFLV